MKYLERVEENLENLQGRYKMATLLDTSLLNFLLPLFSFLLVLFIVYAVMDKFSLVGDNKGLHWAVAFCIAFIFLFSSDAVKFLNLLTPWYILMVVFGLFLVSFFVFLGVSKEKIEGAVSDPKVYWGVIGISLLVFFIALGNVFGSTFAGGGGGSGGKSGTTASAGAGAGDGEPVSEGIKAIVHPRVLGALFLLIIAAFAIRLISEQSK